MKNRVRADHRIYGVQILDKSKSLHFADAHAHSNPVNGLGASEIAKRFKRKGGWFVALVGLSPWHYSIDEKNYNGYIKAIQLHIKECRAMAAEGLQVACFAGFHPADVDKLISAGKPPEEVLRLGLQVIEYVGKLCRDGVIDGIGEVGRQHYRTSPDRFAIAMSIMMRALELARDNDCLVHLHLENAGTVTVLTIDEIVKRVGLNRSKVFLHHVKPRIGLEAIKRGYQVTIPGHKETLRYAFGIKELAENMLIESDYIDDPRRPCVSSCPWDIVDRELELMVEGIVDENTLYKVNVDNIVKAYGVEHRI